LHSSAGVDLPIHLYHQVYTLDEIPELVSRYGLPKDWIADGISRPDRDTEAQVWDDPEVFCLQMRAP